MDNKKRKKYDRIAKITGILAGLILVLGTSYAVFRTVTRGEQDSVISAGKLDVRIENEQDEITLENAFPITEEEGKKQTPYTFDVVNEGTINAEYDLYIEIDESVSTLPANVVRYYLTVEEDGVEKIVTSSSRTISQEEVIEKEGKKLYKIDNKYLDTDKSNHYKLYLWVDYDATTEQATNKTFEAKVSIEAAQIYDKNKLIQQIDVSANGDGSVTAYMYANGNIVVKGQGTIKDNLSNTLVYMNPDALSYYKRAFIALGCNEEEVNQLETMGDLQSYAEKMTSENPDIMNNFENTVMLIVMQDVLEDLGYDTNGVELTTDAYMAYLVEQGLMDEEGQFTEKGQEFYTNFEEKANSINNPTIPAKSIVLEDGITNIPEGLFTGNEDITEVRIPASVTTIANRAFYGCTKLKEIKLPDTVTSIGVSAFYNCTNLQSVNIPSSLTKIENYTFSNCISLTEVYIPSQINTIGSSAFTGCTNIKKLTLDGTKNYGSLNFSTLEELVIYGTGNMNARNIPWSLSSSSLKKVTVQPGIASIAFNAFQNFTSLNSVEMADSVISIQTHAFRGCINLTSIKMPNNLKTISSSAFENCGLLKNVTLSNNLQEISDSAFKNCVSLTEIVIPDSVTVIGASAFEDCISLEKIQLSENLTEVENYVFENCKKLTSIELPSNVISIGYNTFHDCTALESIQWSDNIQTIDTYAFQNCTSLTKVKIPNSVTEMGQGVFQNCTALTKAILSDALTSINHNMFSGCTSLIEVEIPNSLTSINASVFKDCTALKTIDLPNQLTTISSSAFQNCTNLLTIEIPSTVTEIGSYAFSGCTHLDNVTLPPNLGTISSRVFENCINLSSIIIPASVTEIETSAFANCTGLTELVIPGNVETIESQIISGCTNLKKLTIPATKHYSYLGCENIEELILTGIGNMYNWSGVAAPWRDSRESIQKVQIADTLTSIGTSAFSGFTGLTEINIPDSITTIGQNAFNRCTNIVSITISNNVTNVNSSAFYGWTSSQTINIDNTEAYVTENWNDKWTFQCNAQINYLRT